MYKIILKIISCATFAVQLYLDPYVLILRALTLEIAFSVRII